MVGRGVDLSGSGGRQVDEACEYVFHKLLGVLDLLGNYLFPNGCDL